MPLLRHRLDQLHTERAEISGLIETTLGRGVPELFLIEEEYRLSLLAAETAFVDELIAKLTDPVTGWASMWAEFHGQSGPPAAVET